MQQVNTMYDVCNPTSYARLMQIEKLTWNATDGWQTIGGGAAHRHDRTTRGR
jgi:hypothetical protein